MISWPTNWESPIFLVSIVDQDIIIKKLDSNDKYLLLASDGVWDVMSPKEIIDKCDAFYPTLNVESATKKILADCASKWAEVDTI